MRFRAIACDYDRTLAEDGRVVPETVDVLRRGRASGRKLILITGRALDDLRSVFSDLSLFDLVVAENGALLFDPALGSEEPLCASPPATFLRLLRARGVPFTVGKRVVATIRPHEIALLELVQQMNLGLDVAFNRESVMVLPSGVDKGTGLTAALARLGIAPAEVVGIGDAENDLPFLRLCGFSVAVANAIDSLKEQVDLVTRADYGAGATEIIDRVVGAATLP
ncbi:MAG: Cof-type HAD-IIB family hydrolase [Acidobacteriia bacterium]|nr:Cof-type HAD-IIB family hydrolase [Terriglobia bacterium]